MILVRGVCLVRLPGEVVFVDPGALNVLPGALCVSSFAVLLWSLGFVAWVWRWFLWRRACFLIGAFLSGVTGGRVGVPAGAALFGLGGIPVGSFLLRWGRECTGRAGVARWGESSFVLWMSGTGGVVGGEGAELGACGREGPLAL